MSFLSSLKGKVLASVFAGVAALWLVALFAILQLNTDVNHYQTMLQHQIHSATEIGEVNKDFLRQVQEWKNVLLRGDEDADRSKYWRQFNERSDAVQSRVSKLMGKVSDPELLSELKRFKDSHSQLQAQYKRGFDEFMASGFDADKADAVVRGIDREPGRFLRELSDSLVEKSLAREEELQSHSEWVTTASLITLFIVALVVFFAISAAMSQQFLRPLGLIMEEVNHIAEGRFDNHFSLSRKDELGDLAQNIQEMKHNLGGIITNIRTSSKALNEAAQQLGKSTNTIVSSTSEAESFSGHVAAAMTEMSSTINEVASNANSAAGATQTADESSQSGLKVMESTMSAINSVAQNINSIAGDIAKLEQDTTSVGAVLDVIKGIAEQTNLLALNAAIEAARAGEQGRGFAVVADEVRALAQRTQESTEEIHQIIEAVQNGAQAATVSMHSCTQQTAEAVSLANNAGDSIREISGAVGRIRDMNNQIAAAAEEQSVAAEEISRNVVNMAELSEKAHHSSDSSRGVVMGLEQTAKDLFRIVEQFRI